MVWTALLSARSARRLSRWRVVWPLDASSGLVTASLAKAASLRQRPGWENDTMAWAALTGGDSGLVSQPGCKVIDDRGQLVAVGLPARGRLGAAPRRVGGSRRGARLGRGWRGQAGDGGPS